MTLFKILATLMLFVASAQAQVSSNRFKIGDGTNTNKQIIFNTTGVLATSPSFEWDSGTSQIVFSNDGSNFFPIPQDVDLKLALQNIAVKTSVLANALTVSLVQADGVTNLSATHPGKIPFRNSTATNGGFVLESATSSPSVVVPLGATLGLTSGSNVYVYVYAIDNAGAIEVALSSSLRDESVVGTTTAITTGADDDGFYSTSARTNVPFKLLAKLLFASAPNGTYAFNASNIEYIGNPYFSAAANSVCATPTTSNPSLDSFTFTAVPEMSFTYQCSGRKIHVSYSLSAKVAAAACSGETSVYIDGVQQADSLIHDTSDTSGQVYRSYASGIDVACSGGTHTISLEWRNSDATNTTNCSGFPITGFNTNRSLCTHDLQ